MQAGTILIPAKCVVLRSRLSASWSLLLHGRSCRLVQNIAAAMQSSMAWMPERCRAGAFSEPHSCAVNVHSSVVGELLAAGQAQMILRSCRSWRGAQQHIGGAEQHSGDVREVLSRVPADCAHTYSPQVVASRLIEKSNRCKRQTVQAFCFAQHGSCAGSGPHNALLPHPSTPALPTALLRSMSAALKASTRTSVTRLVHSRFPASAAPLAE